MLETKEEIEGAFLSWGAFRSMLDGIAWHQPETRAKECEHIVFLEGEQVSLNSTERNGGAMSRFAKRFPLESNINAIIRDCFTTEQRRIIYLRYLHVNKKAEALGTRSIARILSISDKKVRNRLAEAQQIVKKELNNTNKH